MKTYKIPVDYRKFGDMLIQAESLEEAIEKALTTQGLPTDDVYMEDSILVDKEALEDYIADGELIQ